MNDGIRARLSLKGRAESYATGLCHWRLADGIGYSFKFADFASESGD